MSAAWSSRGCVGGATPFAFAAPSVMGLGVGFIAASTLACVDGVSSSASFWSKSLQLVHATSSVTFVMHVHHFRYRVKSEFQHLCVLLLVGDTDRCMDDACACAVNVSLSLPFNLILCCCC